MKEWQVWTVAIAIVAGLGTSAQAVAENPAAAGDQIFRQRCQSCHSVNVSKPSTLGPVLAGVVGRKAASTTFKYSDALKASNVTWTRANLDRYLSGPARMVPGTKMSVVLSDPAQRAALIQYLSTTR